jgi:glucosamine-6-phosphate deaminase
VTSPGPRLEILPAAAWARTVAAELAARLAARPGLRLCLPTGDTPTPLYAELVALEGRGACSFAGATVVLLDEWVGLDAGDPARCDTRLRAQLVDRLVAPPAFVPIDVDGPDIDDAVATHDAAAAVLDLALLGIGANGHVGFNEPGSTPDDRTRVVALAQASRDAAVPRYGASRVPTAGVTVGMDRLLAAGEVWLLVTGAAKAGILCRALREPEGPACPASWLRRHPRLVVFADEAAASQLG